MKVGVCGARGRMGTMNVEAVLATDGLTLGAALEREGHQDCGKDMGDFIKGAEGVRLTDDAGKFFESCEAVIDFTIAPATMQLLERAKGKKVKFAIGTTGLSKEDEQKMAEYAKDTPIVHATNMNMGVNVLFSLVEQAAKMLGSSYEVEIVEAHHNKKKDSPSGTALTLARTVAKEFDIDLEKEAVYGRSGMPGERTKSEIGIHALRAADIVGEHTVMFCAEGERIELAHKSNSRKGYAFGAARALLWLADKDKGLFSMRDVLGL